TWKNHDASLLDGQFIELAERMRGMQKVEKDVEITWPGIHFDVRTVHAKPPPLNLDFRAEETSTLRVNLEMRPLDSHLFADFLDPTGPENNSRHLKHDQQRHCNPGEELENHQNSSP